MGLWGITRDEVPDPQSVAIRTWVNGRLTQDGTTASMIFGVAELVSYLLALAVLHAGAGRCRPHRDTCRARRCGASAAAKRS
ncbi:fumarylacetoacetate hydrolase family protein [Streptomyces capillispiralis]|uniref:fumarylacetoacetate hydrolase family protein n=1 Tax=Streptomyces capillispiralis TaxID=68182 RepID=UPI003676FDBD